MVAMVIIVNIGKIERMVIIASIVTVVIMIKIAAIVRIVIIVIIVVKEAFISFAVLSSMWLFQKWGDLGVDTSMLRVVSNIRT